jgi:hypothetical protein
MIILYILLAVFALLLLLFLWAILTSFILYINTEQNIYYLKLTSIVKIQLLFDEELFLFRLRIFFLNFKFNPLKFYKKKKIKAEKEEKEGKEEKEDKDKPDRKRKKKRMFTFSQARRMVRDIIRSFNVKVLKAEIDSGDVVTNAYLVPAFVFANRNNINLSANNSGLNSLELKLQNRIIKLLYIFLKYRFTNR